MVKNKRMDQMKDFDIRAILNKGEITSELELERAFIADRSLRLLSKDDPQLAQLRSELRKLISQYESTHWSDENTVTKAQIIESELAEAQAEAERLFIKKRKELILSRINGAGLKQKDLGTLLHHNKSYTSELLNGIRAFSSADLILIHKLLNIGLEDLFMTIIPVETQVRVNAALEKIAAVNGNAKSLQLTLLNK